MLKRSQITKSCSSHKPSCSDISSVNRSFHNPHKKINRLWQHPQSCLDLLLSQPRLALLNPKIFPTCCNLRVPASRPQTAAGGMPCLQKQPSCKDPLSSLGSKPTPICSPCKIEKPSLPLPNKHLGFKIQLACVISVLSPCRGETQPASSTLPSIAG